MMVNDTAELDSAFCCTVQVLLCVLKIKDCPGFFFVHRLYFIGLCSTIICNTGIVFRLFSDVQFRAERIGNISAR